ncbi:putative membrane transporter protein [Gammaproteobacteria bacterium]
MTDVPLPLWELTAYLAIGSLAGILAGLLGVGGGLVIVPVLLWVFSSLVMNPDVIPHLAIGTSLATIVVTALSSMRAHQSRGAIGWDWVWGLTPGILLGAWMGAVIAAWLPGSSLKRTFGCFVILLGVQMLLGMRFERTWRLPGRWGLAGVGGVIGVLSALIGIGGGSLTVPFLAGGGVAMSRAVATSAACGFPIAVAGTLGFVWNGWGLPGLPPGSSGFVYWPAVVGITFASSLLAPWGARLAHHLPAMVLKRVFAALLLLIGARLLFS